MAILNILTYPNPILRRTCEKVDKIGQIERELIANLIETMFAAPGAGLAASQVGVPVRIMVVNLSDEQHPGQALALINPQILEQDGEMLVAEEGCLSIPDYLSDVKRYSYIRLRYSDAEGNLLEIEGRDYLARVFQHEIDHLNGTLFIDHLGRIKRDLVKRRLMKKAKTG
ncbi:MAG: peptide deformylase [Candidatus Schekmanbacteria bacterium]|nr:peptide deformylase [Candidatus Schekmanbacteria bacterium]